MKKAQVSLEFILAVSLVLLIFIGFFLFYIDKNREIKRLDSELQLRDECFAVSNTLESALTLGPGYAAQLSTNNNIILEQGTIFIESLEGIRASCSYRSNVYSGNFTGTVMIENQENDIIIQNV